MFRRLIPFFLILTILLGACIPPFKAEPTSTHTAVPSKTKTATPTPTATLTPTITPSPTPVPPTATPTMTAQERAALRLYEVSLTYIAETNEDAKAMVKKIDYLDGHGRRIMPVVLYRGDYA